MKLVFWYDLVKNESTSLAGYTKDRKDNIFTLQTDISGDKMVKIVDQQNNILTIVGKNGLQFTQPDKNELPISVILDKDDKSISVSFEQ